MLNTPIFQILIFHFILFKDIHDIDSGHVQRDIVVPIRFIHDIQYFLCDTTHDSRENLVQRHIQNSPDFWKQTIQLSILLQRITMIVSVRINNNSNKRMDERANERTHAQNSSQDRLITQVLSHIGLMQNANTLLLTPRANAHSSIEIANHVRRLRGDSESQRHVVHVENHHTGVLGTTLRNTRQTYTHHATNAVETSFRNVVAVQERHLGTWLHPHFVLGGTIFEFSIPGHTVLENRGR